MLHYISWEIENDPIDQIVEDSHTPKRECTSNESDITDNVGLTQASGNDDLIDATVLEVVNEDIDCAAEPMHFFRDNHNMPYFVER